MATGFGTVDFNVRPNGDLLPVPDFDPQTGMETYKASILLPTETDLANLRLLICGVTVIGALGGGGIVVVERGPGKKTLTYPKATGAETTATAILTAVTAQVRMTNEGYIEADCEWQFVSS